MCSQNCEKQVLALSCLSTCPHVCPPAWNNSAPTGYIFMKSDMRVFFENVSGIQVLLISDKNNAYFT